MLTIPTSFGPTSSGRGMESGWARAFENRADRLGIGEDVELFDLDPDMPDAGVGKTRIADPGGKALAQIDMPGRGDMADRRDDFLVIDDAPAVLAGNAGVLCRGQLDRNAHPLRAV